MRDITLRQGGARTAGQGGDAITPTLRMGIKPQIIGSWTSLFPVVWWYQVLQALTCCVGTWWVYIKHIHSASVVHEQTLFYDLHSCFILRLWCVLFLDFSHYEALLCNWGNVTVKLCPTSLTRTKMNMLNGYWQHGLLSLYLHKHDALFKMKMLQRSPSPL